MDFMEAILKAYNPNAIYNLRVSDLVNRDISTAKGSRKPIRLDCL